MANIDNISFWAMSWYHGKGDKQSKYVDFGTASPILILFYDFHSYPNVHDTIAIPNFHTWYFGICFFMKTGIYRLAIISSIYL